MQCERNRLCILSFTSSMSLWNAVTLETPCSCGREISGGGQSSAEPQGLSAACYVLTLALTSFFPLFFSLCMVAGVVGDPGGSYASPPPRHRAHRSLTALTFSFRLP